MDDATRHILDKRIKEIEDEQKSQGPCDKSRMFLYSVRFTFEGEDGIEYSPPLPAVACCLLEVHKFVYNRMWAVAEGSLGFTMTGCCITKQKEMYLNEKVQF